ncbi:hypothetical protein E2562_027841 [Oryza meyeriana var. granulata]|uniref:Uncharacterized protein n=1 Tax=Oryza meyeriana var. granulata TaxID=110450 RepID=A0A6G1DPZ7_9ORYZ|nr:hypothetical protein E2562_027841 [Oryza meyeriana var. granulata]
MPACPPAMPRLAIASHPAAAPPPNTGWQRASAAAQSSPKPSPPPPPRPTYSPAPSRLSVSSAASCHGQFLESTTIDLHQCSYISSTEVLRWS